MGSGIHVAEAYDHTMRFGISVTSSHVVDDHRVGARWMVERAAAARDAGLDHLSLGDGHVTATPYYQGVPMLGRMLAEWDASRPAGCYFLLPLWNPVLVAEQVATLATMLEAPFILQASVGSGPERFDGMGGDLRTRGRDLDESIRVIKALLAGESVDSDRFAVKRASIAPMPPRPVEWWIGASAPVALRRAAREADAWYAGPHITSEQATVAFDIYRGACEAAGRPARSVRRRDVLVLNDGDRARTIGQEMVAAGYRGMGLDQVAVGGVAEVTEVLAGDLDAGFDDIAVRCMSPDQAVALETIELCGEIRVALD
jgi:alkanesulfonate monooxygenase SsuD/methylene tetrahydromethanopterin reductase-like flavin-dependent oxidoreductase (luciferase family)